jgi:hyperosmotically inducible protein
MTTPARLIRLAAAVATALAGLALAGCNKPDAPADRQVSAGRQLDDAVITTKVKTALLTQSEGKAVNTSVETHKGEVLLSGFVDDQPQAEKAVALAKGVEGVTAVQNKLMIKEGPSSAGTKLDDSVITVKVKTALMSNNQTRANEIAVTTNKGVVQLSGFVDSADEQARATAVARNVEGVQNVVNDTSIKQ